MPQWILIHLNMCRGFHSKRKWNTFFRSFFCHAFILIHCDSFEFLQGFLADGKQFTCSFYFFSFDCVMCELKATEWNQISTIEKGIPFRKYVRNSKISHRDVIAIIWSGNSNKIASNQKKKKAIERNVKEQTSKASKISTENRIGWN